MKLRTYSNDPILVEKRRKYIIKRATEVLAKKGYHSTSIRELYTACNMSSGAIYHYFGSKEEILFAIIDSASSKQLSAIENVVAESKDSSPTEALISVFSALMKWHDDNQDISLFIYQETKNLPKEARVIIFNSEEKILSLLEQILRNGKKLGEFDIDDPKLVAHNLMLIAHGWALRRWLLRKYYTREKYLKDQIDLLLKMVSKHRNQRHGAKRSFTKDDN